MAGSPDTRLVPNLPEGLRAALVIATTSYQDPELRQLRAPAHDADDLAEVLGNPRIGAFTVTRVIDQDEPPPFADVGGANGRIQDPSLRLEGDRVRLHPPHRAGRVQRLVKIHECTSLRDPEWLPLVVASTDDEGEPGAISLDHVEAIGGGLKEGWDRVQPEHDLRAVG